jgi:hypothetical protein
MLKAPTDPTDLNEFLSVYKPNGNKKSNLDVTTSMERNDKTLRSFCAFTSTDVNGVAEFAVPVPQPGRWIAYGDVEFETRSFGDYVAAIEISDLDRMIAWQMALAQDPNATAPVADSVVQANGYPLYPVIGYYYERSFPSTMPNNAKGNIKSGMTMTFSAGHGPPTEAQPVGGYGFLPGGFYLVVKAQKASSTQGVNCQLSVDWAEEE